MIEGVLEEAASQRESIRAVATTQVPSSSSSFYVGGLDALPTDKVQVPSSTTLDPGPRRPLRLESSGTKSRQRESIRADAKAQVPYASSSFYAGGFDA